jgi:hypothetical protein
MKSAGLLYTLLALLAGAWHNLSVGPAPSCGDAGPAMSMELLHSRRRTAQELDLPSPDPPSCLSRPPDPTSLPSHAGSAAARAAGAGASRELQSITLPNVALPSLSAFVPELGDVKMLTVDQFLTKAGLPTWAQLGLPPLAELMKPVGGLQGVKLPSMAEVSTQADTVFRQVLTDLLPAPLQGLAKVNIAKVVPGLNATTIARAQVGAAVATATHLNSTFTTLRRLNATATAVNKVNARLPKFMRQAPLPTLPSLPSGLPSFGALLSSFGLNATMLSGLNAAMIESKWNQPITLPPLKLPANTTLPTLEQVLTVATKVSTLVSALPNNSDGSATSLAEMMAVAKAINSLLKS